MQSGFDLSSLDDALDLLTLKVGGFSARQAAAFFGCVGVALRPLYVRFSEENSWGDATILRAALERRRGTPQGTRFLRMPTLLSLSPRI